MCNIIIINKGEKEIETPRQFLYHFGFMPDEDLKQINIDECLCGCDVEKALKDNKIEFKKDCGDIYIGLLNEVIGDEKT